MTKILAEDQVDEAVAALREGKLVAFPTETVYGLGGDAKNSEAIKRIFEVKGRPVNHPLIVHVSSADDMRLWVRSVPEQAALLAEAFCPGPLTMILQRNGRVAEEAVGNRPTIGLRVPNHPLALRLLETFSEGLAAPSANKFGEVSPTSASHVVDDLGEELDYILDGGKCEVGVESTIIDLVGAPKILRPGGISKQAIEAVLGCPVEDDIDGASRAPGMLKSHYAPKASITLVTIEELLDPDFELEPDVGVIAPVSIDSPLSWRMPNDAQGYSRSLYAVLREADYRKVKKLLIAPPTEGDLVETVLDRLAKASAPRI